MFTLFLAAVWPAVTSHTLLEQAGLIHVVHADHHHSHDHDYDHSGDSHEHNADDHDFADGNYWTKTSQTKTPRPDFTLLNQTEWLAAALTNPPAQLFFFGPGPPGISPPELLHRWNFVLRTAVDARAPSFLS